MCTIEVALTNIGEIAVRDIAREEKPQGIYMKRKPKSLLYQKKIH